VDTVEQSRAINDNKLEDVTIRKVREDPPDYIIAVDVRYFGSSSALGTYGRFFALRKRPRRSIGRVPWVEVMTPAYDWPSE